jgi:hypothetical protein
VAERWNVKALVIGVPSVLFEVQGTITYGRILTQCITITDLI